MYVCCNGVFIVPCMVPLWYRFGVMLFCFRKTGFELIARFPINENSFRRFILQTKRSVSKVVESKQFKQI